MRQIFMSYDQADEAFVMHLADDLEAHGANVWLDVRHARPGRHWARSIERALSESSMMIVILSPEALESEQVAGAWQMYLEAYRPVIPVVVEPCNVPGPLRTRRPIDFTRDRFYRRALHELTTRLIDYNSRSQHTNPIWATAAGDLGYDRTPADPSVRSEPAFITLDDDPNTIRRMVRGLRAMLGR
jgi:hypothetical protein